MRSTRGKSAQGFAGNRPDPLRKGSGKPFGGTANTKRGGKRPSRAFFKNIIQCSIVASEKSHIRRTPSMWRNGLRRSPGELSSASDRQTLMREGVLEHSTYVVSLL